MASLRGWRYCPRCAAGLEREEGAVRCPACGFRGFAGSSATASALVVRDGRLLLARRAVEPARGKWDLPGGFLAEGEHPRDGVVRELREETGLEVEPLELVAIEMDTYGPDGEWTLNLYWAARAVEGEPEPADDVAELRWLAPDELPAAEELAFPNVARVLARWRRSAGPAS